MSAPTAVHSNAFNFASFAQAGVDSRTGLFTASFSFPNVRTHDLAGPEIPLQLTFSPLKTQNDGYGVGWSLPFTEYQPSTQIVSVHSGETFKVTGNYSDEREPDRLKMKEQKIQHFKLYKLTGDPLGDFKVVHKSGQVEILKLTGTTPQIAMPVKIYSEQGHEVTLTYQSGGQGRMLSRVSDPQGVLLEVVRNLTASTVEIRVRPVQGVPLAVFILQLEGDRMTRVTLPTANKAGWRFLYGEERKQLCITEVWDPLGAHQKIQYNDGGHGFPGDSGFENLPRVTDHVTDPGAGQPPIVKTYRYSNNGHNFLGHNSEVEWSEDGLDNLYKVIGQYLYETIESLMVAGLAVRTVTRTFNRFHLMTSEISTQGNCQKTLKITYYANDTDPFDQQDPRCQLARQTTEMWHLSDDPRYWRQDKKFTEYDLYGNLTRTVHANGIIEEIVYFPADEVAGECPADPHGFVKHVREKTVIPATDPTLVPDLQAGAATLRSRYRYEIMRPVSGGTTPWVALIEERLLEVTESSERLMQRALYTYIDDPANLLAHGRRQQQAVTVGSSPGYTTLTDFAYSKHLATYATFAGETVLRTVETLTTDFDSVSKSVTHERSLLNGEPLLITDKDEQLRYTYDALGRVVKEEEAPNTPWPASRTFTYRLIRPAGQGDAPVTELAGQEMEDVKKVKIRTWFDGLGRSIREERQDLDNAGGNPPAYRRTYEANYDAYGQLSDDTEIDWLEKTDLRQKTTYTYDLWGQQNSVTGADGITRHTRDNPITFTSEQWIAGVGKTVTLSNRFEKTVRTEQFGLSGQRISLHRYKYNGLGYCTEEIDALGRVTQLRYDAHARLTGSTLPDRTQIRHAYATHSATPLMTALTVQPGNILLPPQTVGRQQFDGLERLTQVNVGGRVETLHYEDGRLQPSRRTTPAGKDIHYEYKFGLTTQPTLIKPPEDEARFDYDLLNGNLETSTNARGSYSFSYSHAGHLSVESWKDSTHPTPWVTRYTSSLKGRQLTRTDVGGHVTQATYHQVNGRLIALSQSRLQADFEYDSCGRLYRTTSHDLDSGNTLITTLAFDDAGREINRSLALQDAQGQALQPVRSIELGYLADGNVHTRHLRVGGATALLEKFSYDLRARLELHECSGNELPKDRFDNAIFKQYFESDALDNVIYSRTDFTDGSHDIAHFSFAANDPCQLVKVTHSHPDYQGLLGDFTYDPDGNLTRDERGQQLRYDSQGRLLGVATANDQPLCDYDYDAHDHLVAVKPQGEPELLRFYEGTRLSDTMQNGKHTQLLNDRGHPLGQQTPGDASQTLLLLADAKHSVIAESQADELRISTYTAYGERSGDPSLKSLLAFNGEVCDPVSGWYLLGRGYRAYNPHLMCFHSPDSLSPFGSGGINCYKYCRGNPIAFSDPSGHAASPSLVQQPGFYYGTMAASVFLGIVLSVVTLNPVPLALTVGTVLSAAGASTAAVVSVFNGVLAATAAITTASNILSLGARTWGGLGGLGLGVEAASMLVKDQTTQNTMSWIGFGLNWIMLPKFKAIKAPVATGLKHTADLRKVSNSADSSFTWGRLDTDSDYMFNKKTSGSNWETKVNVPAFSKAEPLPRHPPHLTVAKSRLGTILEESYGTPYSGGETLVRSSVEHSSTPVELIEIPLVKFSKPPPRTQEWLGAGIRQAVHKPILSLAHRDMLK